MTSVRRHAARGFGAARPTLLLCALHCWHALPAESRPATILPLAADPQGRQARVTDFKFTHLTTNDGLSQGYVVDILQDRRGFMWFATRDGLNRYDGYTFVVYKHDPNDPGSLSSNFLQDLMEDDHGNLWVATNTGVNRFDPRPSAVPGTFMTPTTLTRSAVLRSRASPRTVAAISGSAPRTAASTGSIQGSERLLTIEMTAMGGSSGGSLRSSRIATGTSGLRVSVVCST